MKNILIPTDFSYNAWNATRYAIELFRDEPCVFHLLNVYTPAIASSRFMASTLDGKTIHHAARMHSENGLREFVKRIENTYNIPHHSVHTISSFNLLVDEIKNAVEKEGINFIVMGTKGCSGIEEVFLGSNTVRVIKSIKNCPLLAIPQDFKFVTPTEIAFATDFNRFYTPSELMTLIDMAKVFDAVIRIIYIQRRKEALTELQQFNRAMLCKYLKDVAHFVHTETELDSVSKTLELFTHELDIHLLAMLNFQHSYMERLTREHIVKRVAFHSRIPLLIIPELQLVNYSGRNESRANTLSH
jgi:nucleotide-binding universal stress UspA family protein